VEIFKRSTAQPQHLRKFLLIFGSDHIAKRKPLLSESDTAIKASVQITREIYTVSGITQNPLSQAKLLSRRHCSRYPLRKNFSHSLTDFEKKVGSINYSSSRKKNQSENTSNISNVDHRIEHIYKQACSSCLLQFDHTRSELLLKFSLKLFTKSFFFCQKGRTLIPTPHPLYFLSGILLCTL